jgi:hypothetical protein
VIGCWLGVALLFFPFYATIQEQTQTDGFKFMYKNGSGFLDLSMPMDLWHELKSTGRLHTDIVLKIVFVILFFAGLPLSTFLYTHICCMAQGLTTIEKMAKIEFQRCQLLLRKGNNCDDAQSLQPLDLEVEVINPFHQGVRNNVMQIIDTKEQHSTWSVKDYKIVLMALKKKSDGALPSTLSQLSECDDNWKDRITGEITMEQTQVDYNVMGKDDETGDSQDTTDSTLHSQILLP